MSNWSALAANDHAIQLRTFGEPITYTPAQGTGDPVSTTAILETSVIDQSSAPGVFAQIRVDPAVITPVRGDVVTWADGTVYIVANIAPRRAYEMPLLSLQAKWDPPEAA